MKKTMSKIRRDRIRRMKSKQRDKKKMSQGRIMAKRKIWKKGKREQEEEKIRKQRNIMKKKRKW